MDLENSGSWRKSGEGNEVVKKTTLRDYVEVVMGGNWEDFKAAMKVLGIEPAYFAMSPIDQLEESFMDIARGVLQQDEKPVENPYADVLKKAAEADFGRNASAKIDAAAASMRDSAAHLIAMRREREGGVK